MRRTCTARPFSTTRTSAGSPRKPRALIVADSSTTESVNTASPTSTASTSRSGGASAAPVASVNTGGRRASARRLPDVSTPSDTSTTAASGRPACRSRTAAIAAARSERRPVGAVRSPNGDSVSPSASVSTANVDSSVRLTAPAVRRAASKRVPAPPSVSCMLREASTTMATSASVACVGGERATGRSSANTSSAHVAARRPVRRTRRPIERPAVPTQVTTSASATPARPAASSHPGRGVPKVT